MTYSPIDFFHFNKMKIKVQLMLYTNFQPNISRGSGEKADYSCLAILATAAIFYSQSA